MYAKIAENYTAEDIDAIGDGFVRMHGIIRKLSEPAMIDFLEKMSDLPSRINLAAGQTHRPHRPDVQNDGQGLPRGVGRGRGDDQGPGENQAGGGRD